MAHGQVNQRISRLRKASKNAIPKLSEAIRKLFLRVGWSQSNPSSELISGDVYQSHRILDNATFKKHILKNGRSRPIMLICETVNICNNNCIICPYHKMTRKKEIMPLSLFEKVLRDYSDMGGGALSLTPMVGDVFLDKFLLDRIRLIKQYRTITKIGFTTNAVLVDQFSDKDLTLILENMSNIHLSVYGMDGEEYLIMTKRNSYSRLLGNIKRLLALVDDRNKIKIGFRFLKQHSENDIRQWMFEHFGTEFQYGYTSFYANWGNTLNTHEPLPLQGKWFDSRENTAPCIIPLVACQVFSNGDVSFCHCCDYDAIDDFRLGNLKAMSLTALYNSEKNRRLWRWENDGKLPTYCKQCTFHVPLSSVMSYQFIFENPLDFIGG